MLGVKHLTEGIDKGKGLSPLPFQIEIVGILQNVEAVLVSGTEIQNIDLYALLLEIMLEFTVAAKLSLGIVDDKGITIVDGADDFSPNGGTALFGAGVAGNSAVWAVL